MKGPETGFNDRLSAAAEAKKALLAKFKPKPAAIDPLHDQRQALRDAEREAFRKARAAEKEAVRLAALEAEEAARRAAVEAMESADEIKRRERKERKAAMKAEAKAKREAKLAARH
jgi:hypothetical protein